MSLPEEKDRLYGEVKRLMMNDWDPIGVQGIPEAEDEYDTYALRVCEMLTNGRDAHDLFDYLWWLETRHMGLAGDRQHTKSFSERLAKVKKLEGR